jgi:hypothetical protein
MGKRRFFISLDVILRMVQFCKVSGLCQEIEGFGAARATTLVKERLGATTRVQAYNSVSTESGT